MDQQPCKNRLATATRQMLYSGAVCLIDSRGRHSNDIQLFLFTDMLLLTEPNKVAGRKESHRREVMVGDSSQQYKIMQCVLCS